MTTRQKTKLRNVFGNNISTDIKLSKTQISKIIQSGGFLGALLSKIAGPLMKVANPFAKNILAPLEITVAASAIDVVIQKIISNEEMNDIMKLVQALEFSKTLLKSITKTIESETKEQKGGFLGILFGTLGARLLGNMLTGKGILRAGYGNKQGKGILRAGYGSKMDF